MPTPWACSRLPAVSVHAVPGLMVTVAADAAGGLIAVTPASTASEASVRITLRYIEPPGMTRRSPPEGPASGGLALLIGFRGPGWAADRPVAVRRRSDGGDGRRITYYLSRTLPHS